jgi:uncharacterized membrane protein
MLSLLWVSLITSVVGIALLLVWALTGRRNQLMLRIAGLCGIVCVVAGFLATRPGL